MKLYLVESALRSFLDEVERGDGSLTPEQEARLSELCEGGERLIEFLAVMGSEAFVQSQLHSAMATEAKKQVQAMEDNAEMHLQRMSSAHQRIQKLMDQLGIDKYKSPLFSISVVQSPPKVYTPEVIDLDNLPPQFVRVKKELNRSEIGQAISEGRPIPEGYGLASKKIVRVTRK